MYRAIVLGICLLLIGTTPVSWAAEEAPSPITILAIEKELHFMAPNGTDVTVKPGTYRIQTEAEESKLWLIPSEAKQPIEVQATTTDHELKLAAPVALSLPGKEDEHLIALLLPEGKGFQAVGSSSAVRTRGFKMKMPKFNEVAKLANPNNLKRAAQCAKGDTKQMRRIVDKVTDYAVGRFQLQNLVTQPDLVRTESEFYNFLKWKMGGPGLVCAQFITAGYEHFQRAYSDEAAAIALGVIEFSQVEPELVMPPWMQNYLKGQAGAAGVGLAGYLTAQGVPAPLANMVGQKVSEVLVKGVARNVKGFIPKAYDVDNRLVAQAIKARQQAGAVNRAPVHLTQLTVPDPDDTN